MTSFTTTYLFFLFLQASQREIQWVIRAAVIVAGLLGTSLTSLKNSIITMLILACEMSFILVFPQLTSALFINISNSYGAVMGLLTGLVLRLLSGVPSLGLAPVIHFPGCTLEDGVYVQYFPFKIFSVLSAFAAIFLFSFLTSVLFNKGVLPEKWDVFKVKAQPSPQPVTPTEDDENVNFLEMTDQQASEPARA